MRRPRARPARRPADRTKLPLRLAARPRRPRRPRHRQPRHRPRPGPRPPPPRPRSSGPGPRWARPARSRRSPAARPPRATERSRSPQPTRTRRARGDEDSAASSHASSRSSMMNARRPELGRQELVVRRLVVGTERAREVDDRHGVVGQSRRLGDAVRVVGDRAVPLVDRCPDRCRLESDRGRRFARFASFASFASFAKMLDGRRRRFRLRAVDVTGDLRRHNRLVRGRRRVDPDDLDRGRAASGAWASSGGSS